MHINGEKFRADWAEIIKGEDPYDVKGSDIYSIFLEDIPLENNFYEFPFLKSINFRATWQNNNTRFRLLPKSSKERNTSSKLEWPTYYLGLSRLYPVGESSSIDVKKLDLSESETKYYFDNHKKILSSMDKYKEFNSLSIKETKRKNSSGIITESYGSLSNSAGQDNLSQILFCLLSFMRLKEKLEDNYIGGMLLIDEIDATLHPAAQNHLIDFLFKESNKLKIQIVFTTHSLTILEHIKKFQDKSSKNLSSVSLQYFTTGRGVLEIKENPTLTYIKNDLLISYNRNTVKLPITLYSEDEVGRWFFKQIISKYSNFNINNLNLIDMSIGYNELLKLIKQDYAYFNNNVITVLDPDVTESKIKAGLKGTMYNYDANNTSPKESLLVLPGKNYIEKEMWDFLFSLNENHDFYYEPDIENVAFYKQTLIDSGPSRRYNKGSIKDKTKTWFLDNEDICTIAFPYWYSENKAICDDFMTKLISIYNCIATNTGRTKIKSLKS